MNPYVDPEDETPPGVAVIIRTLRIPVALDMRLAVAADRRGIPTAALLREWIAHGVTEAEEDQPVSRAEAMELIAGLRPYGEVTLARDLRARRR